MKKKIIIFMGFILIILLLSVLYAYFSTSPEDTIQNTSKNSSLFGLPKSNTGGNSSSKIEETLGSEVKNKQIKATPSTTSIKGLESKITTPTLPTQTLLTTEVVKLQVQDPVKTSKIHANALGFTELPLKLSDDSLNWYGEKRSKLNITYSSSQKFLLIYTLQFPIQEARNNFDLRNLKIPVELENYLSSPSIKTFNISLDTTKAKVIYFEPHGINFDSELANAFYVPIKISNNKILTEFGAEANYAIISKSGELINMRLSAEFVAEESGNYKLRPLEEVLKDLSKAQIVFEHSDEIDLSKTPISNIIVNTVALVYFQKDGYLIPAYELNCDVTLSNSKIEKARVIVNALD